MITEFLRHNYEEVFYEDFYRELFPVGSFEEQGVYEDGKYNGIAVSIGAGAKNVRRYTITDDLEKIDELVSSNDFCLMSPISYAGKSRKSENARFLYAMAIDVDGINGEKGMRFFLRQIEGVSESPLFIGNLPRPTYLVSSGTGIHIYYVFKKPIALFPSAVKPLEKLKRRLTWQAWTQGAIDKHHRENVQYESLFQGFRMVGSITKVGTRVRAFRVGEKVDLDDLNQFVPVEYRALATDMSYKSNLSLAEAKKKYPEWYERRIVKQAPKGKWICKRDLYDWWKRRVLEVEQGHRYWGLMTLATYAVKCGVAYEELAKDAFELQPILAEKGDPFTEDDVMKALEAYNNSYITYPIDTIVARTGVPIKKNKRNGRTQEKHLQGARAIRDINNENWRAGNGRPKGSGTKRMTIFRWRQAHPEGRKIDCERETGFSRPTVLKWWQEASPIDFRESDREAYIRLQQQLQQELSMLLAMEMPNHDKEKVEMKKQMQDRINKRSVELVKEAFGDAWWKYTAVFWKIY